jgi:hypothetical protein
MHSKSVSLTAEDGFKLILSHGLQEHEYTLCTNLSNMLQRTKR